MGTKKSSILKKAKGAKLLSPQHWEAHIAATKSGAMQVFDDIMKGEIDVADVRKLSNFIHASIALMEVAGQVKWSQAKDLAQFRALTSGEKIYYPNEEPVSTVAKSDHSIACMSVGGGNNDDDCICRDVSEKAS